MSAARDIRVEPISSADARKIVSHYHYSGKSVNNSQLHLGVFLDGRCLGAMQFGPPMDKRKVLPLVTGTEWNNMVELNRMAFADDLPRNSESRALGVAFRLLRKHAPTVKWVLSFADATQCGDGTIYRAAGFLLTGVKPNTQMWVGPNGAVVSRMTMTKRAHIAATGRASMAHARAAGFVPMVGYQLRYLRFVDPAWRDRLAVPVIPYDKIPPEVRMYRGRRIAGVAGGKP